jgi:hypothetical protein
VTGDFSASPRYRHTVPFNVDMRCRVHMPALVPSLRAAHKKAILRRLRGVARRSLPKEARIP